MLFFLFGLMGGICLDFSTLTSLKSCSLDEVKERLRLSKKTTELYVSEVDPDEFSKLHLSSDVEVKVTMTSHIFEKSDAYFYHLFHEVLYRSLKIEVDLDRIRLVQELKLLCTFILIALTLVFVIVSLAFPFKVGLFTLIVGVTSGLYLLYLQKPELSVTHIERRTNFKIINETWLEQLPALYVVDEDEVYVGGHFLTGESDDLNQPFYKVESPEECLNLIELYRICSEKSSSINDELLIGYYFELLQEMNRDVITDLK